MSMAVLSALAMIWAGIFIARNDRSRWRGISLVGAAVAVLGISAAKAHDHEHPELDQWYATRKQPDTGISCCGPSDSYWCNECARGSQVVCTIDDDRDDAKLNRRHVPNGTVVEIPPHKFNKDPNPTGRAVVWLSSSGYVFCFVGISGS